MSSKALRSHWLPSSPFLCGDVLLESFPLFSTHLDAHNEIQHRARPPVEDKGSQGLPSDPKGDGHQCPYCGEEPRTAHPAQAHPEEAQMQVWASAHIPTRSLGQLV